jgi:L-ascorbate metabolism protein UlaG (beta-lactamase superfamily)
MGLTYIFHGHACFTLRSDDATLLFDPFLTDNPAAQVKADDLAAGHILLSHGHFDHLPDAVSIAERTGATVIGTFEVASWIGGQGVASVHGMQPGGAFKFPFGRVKQTIAHHGSMLPDGSYGGVATGFIVDIGGQRVYFTGDTALFLDMQLYGEEGIDVLMLPIGDNFTMGAALRPLRQAEGGDSAALRHLAAHCPGRRRLCRCGGGNGRQVYRGRDRAAGGAVASSVCHAEARRSIPWPAAETLGQTSG